MGWQSARVAPATGNELQIILFCLWLVIGWVSILAIGVTGYLVVLLIFFILMFIPLSNNK